MRIDKAQVLDILRSLGKDTAVAERELPDQVDTDEHADLLGKFGISAGELLEQFGAGEAGRDDPNDPHEEGAGGPSGIAGIRRIGGVGSGT